jgi:hypothetical protein
MMSITPTPIMRSVLSRPYANFSWMCSGHLSAEHNPTTGTIAWSKRRRPGSFAGVLT